MTAEPSDAMPLNPNPTAISLNATAMARDAQVARVASPHAPFRERISAATGAARSGVTTWRMGERLTSAGASRRCAVNVQKLNSNS